MDKDLNVLLVLIIVIILVSIIAVRLSDGTINVALTYTVGEDDNRAIVINDKGAYNSIYYDRESNSFICPGAKVIHMPNIAIQASVFRLADLVVTAKINAETLCSEDQEWFDGVIEGWGIVTPE